MPVVYIDFLLYHLKLMALLDTQVQIIKQRLKYEKIHTDICKWKSNTQNEFPLEHAAGFLFLRKKNVSPILNPL